VTFREAIAKRVLVFDGAMGTQIQRHQLTAAEYGGKEGANDLLVLTRPDVVEEIHARYFAVGCDAAPSPGQRRSSSARRSPRAMKSPPVARSRSFVTP